MLRAIPTGKSDLAAYRPFLNDSLFKKIRQKAEKLKGLRVAYVSATAEGGGVVELLKGLIPLMKGVGILVSWFVIDPPQDFFEITKKIHNLLQGKAGELTSEEKEFYLEINRKIAESMEEKKVDLWIIYDPQPAATILYNHFHPSIFRSHIDTSSPNPQVWNFFGSFLPFYDRIVFTLKDYVGPGLPPEKIEIFPPAIDPLSPKNQPLSENEAKIIVGNLGIDTQRPLVTQVSRFDPWKDPLGVITSYKLAKGQIPGLQLALVAQSASDDPEGQRIYEEVKRAAEGDPDIHLFCDLESDNLKVNAFQTASDVILQKSLREGFGLTVTEAMWKGKVVIGGNCGGIKKQIQDGINGFLVNTPQETAEKIIWVLENPQKAKEMGEAAKESVRQNYLLPRLLNDYLDLFAEVLKIN